MKTVWQTLRWLLLVGVCLFAVAQFFGPAKTNPAIDTASTIEAHMPVEPKVAAILDRSCADCHSHKTRWPWYSNVAPVSWFVIDHVNHGRSHLNLSEWGKYNRREQRELLEETCEVLQKGEMPLSSYTPLHPGSKLTEQDVKAICAWTSAQRTRLDGVR